MSSSRLLALLLLSAIEQLLTCCASSQRVTPAQNYQDAVEWAQSVGMSDRAELFGRAALVARDMDSFESVSELTEDERAALIYERDHKWRNSKMLWYSIALCAVGAATQGWDQTGSNGMPHPSRPSCDER